MKKTKVGKFCPQGGLERKLKLNGSNSGPIHDEPIVVVTTTKTIKRGDRSSHFDVVNIDEVPTVIQILFEVFVLEQKASSVQTQTNTRACMCVCVCMYESHQILEHQCEGFLCVDDVMKSDNVGVF